MKNLQSHKNNIENIGFTIIPEIYNDHEVLRLINVVSNLDSVNEKFRKSKDLFAIRQFLNEVPEAGNIVFNSNLKFITKELFGGDYFVVKSIYFDKPETSNWYVAYHQDLTISVDKKVELQNFGPWTVKQNLFAVQPPIDILENIFTIRIHLDETNQDNGALKVIEKSHLKGIYRPETIDWENEIETFGNVAAGGIMIMKPLLLHGSNRTKNQQRRRVIHIEFSNKELPKQINWSERIN